MKQETTTLIRILIVDGLSLFRQAVGGALDREDDLEVIAESHNPTQAILDTERTRPNVAVVDGDLMASGLGPLIGGIKSASPQCKVLVLTSDEKPGALVDALKAGASGCLTKETSMIELIEATRAVDRGDIVVPQHMLAELLVTLVHQDGKIDDSIKTLSRLTRREREVLALLADGSDKDAIARTLRISPQTARTHVQNILAKLGLHSRLEAAAFARKHPILKELVATDG